MGVARIIYGYRQPAEQRTAEVASGAEFHRKESLLVVWLCRRNRGSSPGTFRIEGVDEPLVAPVSDASNVTRLSGSARLRWFH